MNLYLTLTTDSTDFAKRAGFYQDEAARRPVIVSKHGHPRTVLIPYEEFERLRERDRQAYTLDTIPDDLAQAILDSKVPDELGD